MPTEGEAARRTNGKRLLLAAAFSAALATLATAVTGVTLSLFSATASTETDRFDGGSVTLTTDISGTCSITNLLPGTTSRPCHLGVTYSGSVPSYLALDVLIQTQAGTGGLSLYNPADPTHSLGVTITDNQVPPVSYGVPAVATTCPLSAPPASTCYALADELVGLSGMVSGTSITFSTVVTLPAASTNGYQGGSVQIIERVHAAQSSNNGSTNGCSAGQPCLSLSWS